MLPKDNEKLNELINKYYQDHPENDGEVGTLLYWLGNEEALRILQEAKGREIVVIYGEGIDEITEIRFKGEPE